MVTPEKHIIDRRKHELHAITEIATSLTTPLDITDLLPTVMSKIYNVIEPADFGLVMLWDESAGLFRLAATFGLEFESLRDLGLREGESITGKIFQEG
jgi:transcriptional regulator with GAF, ATPase, and Fis domain